MKNRIARLSLLICACFLYSFQAPTNNLQAIFQEALNITELGKHFEKDAAGNFLPVVIISNQLIPDELELVFENEVVKIIDSEGVNKEESTSLLELTSVKFKGNKSLLSFKYQEKDIKIKLKKIDGNWVPKIINVKWKNGFSTSIVSTEKHF